MLLSNRLSDRLVSPATLVTAVKEASGYAGHMGTSDAA
jgi:hypothetical protein